MLRWRGGWYYSPIGPTIGALPKGLDMDIFLAFLVMAAIAAVPSAALLGFSIWADSRVTRDRRGETATPYDGLPAMSGRIDATHARAMLAALKIRNGCAACGFRGHSAALEFAHLPGADKYRTRTGRVVQPSDMASASGDGLTRYAWPTIVAEVNACRVLCANCHAAETADARALASR